MILKRGSLVRVERNAYGDCMMHNKPQRREETQSGFTKAMFCLPFMDNIVVASYLCGERIIAADAQIRGVAFGVMRMAIA